eukprot:SAG22_NODE_1057_length_5776_cov_5.548529_1_plen_79_part_00
MRLGMATHNVGASTRLGAKLHYYTERLLLCGNLSVMLLVLMAKYQHRHRLLCGAALVAAVVPCEAIDAVAGAVLGSYS